MNPSRVIHVWVVLRKKRSFTVLVGIVALGAGVSASFVASHLSDRIPIALAYFIAYGIGLVGILIVAAISTVVFSATIRQEIYRSRSRGGEHLCLHCGYDISGVANASRCPECGHRCDDGKDG